MVAGYAAKELVERGLKPGELTIVSSDTEVPYERPPLSKGFLGGKDSEDSIRINPPSFYPEHGIDLRLRTDVDGVDAARRTLHLRSGDEISFEKLVVATGARPRTLDQPGVLYLRSVDDSKRIREQAAGAKSALVIGSGFIGMEVTAVLAQKGVATTMFMRDDRIWKNVFTPAMSRFFEKYYADRGVQFIKQAALPSGSYDLIVAGIGVTPVTEPLANSGIDLDNGVVVNEYLETSHPSIYAAGDVANYYDTIFKKRRRVEHWDNAVSQGQHCARGLTGDRAPFVHVPYFFSDVFDLSYEFWGDPTAADHVTERGDITSSSFSVWWHQAQRLVAAFVMNRPDDERQAAQQIA
jgi:NADPH-dependent 2,4-dienoyl-CoA reductase/sulfur reductase-like enzyme